MADRGNSLQYFISISGNVRIFHLQKEGGGSFSSARKLLFTPDKFGAFTCQWGSTDSDRGGSVTITLEIAYYDVLHSGGYNASILFTNYKRLHTTTKNDCATMVLYGRTVVFLEITRQSYRPTLMIIRFWKTGHIVREKLERPGRFYGPPWTVIDETRNRIVVVTAKQVILEIWWHEGILKFVEFRYYPQYIRVRKRKPVNYFVDEDVWLQTWSLNDHLNFQALVPVARSATQKRPILISW
jgi:hypothetical protein